MSTALPRMNSACSSDAKAPSLRERWDAFRAENPSVRIRDAASWLGVSEAELVAAGCGETATRLMPEFGALFAELRELGPLLAITRNDIVVHETTAVYADLRLRAQLGLFFRPGQDLRLFFNRWRHAYAVDENRRLSLQFFDAHGTAAHKIYVTDQTDRGAYEALVARYRHPDQGAVEAVAPPPRQAPAVALRIDPDALRRQWGAIRDVHEGQAIIQRHGGDRRQVYRALGPRFARPQRAEVVEALLEQLSAHSIESMIFVMNDAAVQSFAGVVCKLLRTGPWFNVLDPGFNLHIKTFGIGEAWFVRKPTEQGWVSTLDVFDHDGREILLITDRRERGQRESACWTELLEALTAAHSTAPENR